MLILIFIKGDRRFLTAIRGRGLGPLRSPHFNSLTLAHNSIGSDRWNEKKVHRTGTFFFWNGVYSYVKLLEHITLKCD